MRYLPALAVILVLGMSGAAIWAISGSPGVVDGIPPTTIATPPGPPPEPVVVFVDEGEAVQDIAERLEEDGIIDSSIQFRILASLLGYEKLLQRGEYELDPDSPALQVLYRLRRGLTTTRFVTLIEGWRLEEVADVLDGQGVISREEFIETAVAGNFDLDFEFLRRIGPATPLDGYLFPATYFYRRDESAEDLIQQMLMAMDENFTEGLRGDALDVGLTMHEVLTLASIIEREARVPDERPVIAQVFLARLRRGIPLEADPTVQYALAADPESVAEFGYWKAGLTLADLETDSPYNTYRIAGLPLGPIAAPRLESITAVIDPADTNYLFFVAKPDGSHAFAETLDEHLDNIEMYLQDSEGSGQ